MGLRQDSGSPNEFAYKFKAFYDPEGSEQNKAKDKLLVFSDSLSVAKALELQELCASLGLEKGAFVFQKPVLLRRVNK
jgi:nicotinic acid phosphoribosyltransferase